MTERRTPLILDPEEHGLPAAPPPTEAPLLPDTGGPSAAELALRTARIDGRGSLLGRIFWWALGGLVMLAGGLAAERFITGLFQHYEVLGWIGSGLTALVVLGLLGFALRELAAIARLGRIETLRAEAQVASEGSEAALERLIRGLGRLYSGRAEALARLQRIVDSAGDTPDPEARLEIAERELLTTFDANAERAVTRAARDVAAATALIPLTLVDVLAVLAINLRMIRRVAEIYGGRAGILSSWRLLRAVATHLAATGAVAATDDLLGPMVGGGVLGKLSRRFGEAAVNAALTARVGVGAIEVCRPLGFRALARPRARTLVLRALKDWRPEPKSD